MSLDGTALSYREAVGSLMWLAHTSRVDIANAVRAVARQCQNPTVRHWKTAIKIMPYLRAKKDLGITYVRGSGLHVYVYVYADANYADAADDGRLTSGVAVMITGVVVNYSSRTEGTSFVYN